MNKPSLKIFLVLVFYLTTACTNGPKNSAEKCNCNDLVLDEPYNHYYLEERTVPFTGTCVEFNKNGTLNLTKQFVEGKLHGNMNRYRPNGDKLSTVEFDKNFIHGKAIVFDLQGNDSIVEEYKRGKLISN